MKKRKLEPNKIFAFIGKIVVWTSIWALGVAGGIWAFLQNTIY